MNSPLAPTCVLSKHNGGELLPGSMTTPEDAPVSKSRFNSAIDVCFIIGMNNWGTPPDWISTNWGGKPVVVVAMTEAEVIIRVPGANPAKVHDTSLVFDAPCVHIWL